MCTAASTPSSVCPLSSSDLYPTQGATPGFTPLAPCNSPPRMTATKGERRSSAVVLYYSTLQDEETAPCSTLGRMDNASCTRIVVSYDVLLSRVIERGLSSCDRYHQGVGRREEGRRVVRSLVLVLGAAVYAPRDTAHLLMGVAGHTHAADAPIGSLNRPHHGKKIFSFAVCVMDNTITQAGIIVSCCITVVLHQVYSAAYLPKTAEMYSSPGVNEIGI